MSRFLRLVILSFAFVAFGIVPVQAQRATRQEPVLSPEDAKMKAEYVNAVVRGAGYMPWQEKGLSQKEIDFRKQMEERKTKLLAERAPVKRPAMLDAKARERARKNIAEAEWAQKLVESARERADYVAGQPDSFVEEMIGEQTPWYDYGMTCPNCVGVKSQEGTGHGLLQWSYRDPDKLACRLCGEVYPSAKYPETWKLECPRMGQTFTFYANAKEQADPENRTGELAWKWGSSPMHMSFSGVIAKNKTTYMISSLGDLSLTYFITEDPKYARRAQQILLRLAKCYRGWLYHDYHNAVVDGDPLYAAWNDRDLELVWKKVLSTNEYRYDEVHKASVFNFWGAGRLHPSTDDMGALIGLSKAFDMVADAKDADGKPLWSDADKTKVERDLFLEWIFTGEPYLGGPDQAKLNNNKSPRLYNAYAAVACALNLPRLADTAMRGYERLRDISFTDDGFSVESPGYTFMYLSEMPTIPELLKNFDWPDAFAARKTAGDPYENPKLRNIYRATIDTLRPNGSTIPFEDSGSGGRVPGDVLQMGLKHYPEYFGGKAWILGGRRERGAIPPTHNTYPEGIAAGMYALFNLTSKDFAGKEPLGLTDTYFPNWMTALLRNGDDRDAALLAMNFSPPGSHRHGDNLSIYYMDHGNVLLGDHGYVGDSPVNHWITSTFSHNLVIVDGKNQVPHSRDHRRTPKLEQMLSTPRASACEASTDAVPGATEYRRLVVLLKGPDQSTCAVDVFRVKGGKKHAYQLFSEIASSDAGSTGSLKFEGVTLPPEPPLPNFGASLEREHIWGLRDTREAKAPASFTATWAEPARSYRFWSLGQADTVAVSNGPGQETHNAPGRRVRYLNLIHDGPTSDTVSTFVGVHEPSVPDGSMPVKSARRIEVPASAGPEAVAVEVKTVWGDTIVLSDFDNEATVEGVTFQGKLGVVGKDAEGKPWYLASGATTLQSGKLGFSGKPAEWSGTIAAKTPQYEKGDTQTVLEVSGRPAGWSDPPRGCKSYVIVNVTQNQPHPDLGKFDTGYPVAKTARESIVTERFPITELTTDAFRLPALRYSD